MSNLLFGSLYSKTDISKINKGPNTIQILSLFKLIILSSHRLEFFRHGLSCFLSILVFSLRVVCCVFNQFFCAPLTEKIVVQLRLFFCFFIFYSCASRCCITHYSIFFRSNDKRRKYLDSGEKEDSMA